jgi:succinyl-CoA synthetase alpha subunit
MGHAGAIVSGNTGSAASKVKAFEEAGITVAETMDEIVEALSGSLRGQIQQLAAGL